MFWIQILSYITVAIINFGVALFILLRGNKQNYIKWFALTSFLMALYAVPYILLMFWPTSGFLGKFTWIGFFAFPAYLVFVMEFINLDKIKILIVGAVSFLFGGIIFVTTIATELIVPNIIYWYPQRTAGSYGPLHLYARLYIVMVCCFVLVLLARTYKKHTDLQKEKIKYFLTGLIIFISSAFVFTGVLPLITKRLYIDFPLYFCSLWMILTLYAVYKYRLFEITFVIARSVMIIFVTVVLILIQFLSNWALSKILPNFISNFISTILTAGIFFLTPFRYKMQAFFDRIFLKDRYQYLELLKNSIKILNTFPTIDSLFEYIMQMIKTAFNPKKAAILIKSTEETYAVEVSDGLPEYIVKQPISDGLVIWLNKNRQTFIKEEWMERTREWHSSGLYKVLQSLEAQLCIPFIYRNEVKGILSMSNKGNGKTYTVQDIDLLELLCTDAATIIENSRLSYQAATDELTKLDHRRLLMPKLKEALSYAKTKQLYLGLLMIDIDHFKKINDTYGHLCGDEALRHISKIFKEFCSNCDMIYRYGGEEFTMIVTERLNDPSDLKSPKEILINLSENIRKSIEASPLVCEHGSLDLTISVGASIFDGKNSNITVEDLIKEADTALYTAKQQGRNRVVLSEI